MDPQQENVFDFDKFRREGMENYNRLVQVLNKNVHKGILTCETYEIQTMMDQLKEYLRDIAMIYDDAHEHMNALEEEAKNLVPFNAWRRYS